MDRADSCCFTGHRSSRLPWGDDETDPRCLDLKERLAGALEGAYNSGCRHFICGMAQGSALYFAEAVLALRQVHPEITLEAAVPFVGQADRWPEADRLRRQRLLDSATLRPWSSTSLLIAVYDGRPQGGTLNTLSYALRQGVKTVVLDVG